MPNPERANLRVLLAGGGTGGHVFPALAVAQELVQRGCTVSWVGRSTGMERGLVERRGLDYHAVAAKPWLGRGLVDKVSALATLVWSAVEIRRLIRRSGIAVTVGTGGYVSAPAILGSYIARCPVLLLEPNASAGTANRWLSRLSTAACTGYEETGRQLKCRAYWTGTPVRAEFFAVERLDEGDRTLLVVGGSQGALQINQLIPQVLERLARKIQHLRVVHQCGEQHAATVEQEYERRQIDGIKLEIVPFINDMATAMRQATVIISRAGALTLAEITAAGRPAILIPLAVAAGHQRANAEILRAAGAAELVAPGQATVEQLEKLLGDLLDNRKRRERMATAARRLARADAAERIADLVEDLGRAA